MAKSKGFDLTHINEVCFEAIFRFFRRFFQAEIPVRAAALSYHTMLAVVPIIGLVFWYLSAGGFTEKWLTLIKTYFLTVLNVRSSALFLETFEKLSDAVRGTHTGLAGFVLLAYTAWSLITKFGNSLDIILRMHPEEARVSLSFTTLFLRRLLVMFGLPFSLGFTLVVSTWVREDSWLKQLFQLELVGPYFALPLAWTVDIVALFFIYSLVPKRRVHWMEALKVSLVTAVILELTRWGVSTFNTYTVSVHKVYGVFAAIPMLILWIQIAWMVVLSGALWMKPRR